MYCIYHSRDLDGWMSAAIVMRWYEEKYGDLDGLQLIGWDYGDPLPKLAPDIPVIMVDVSFPMAEMERIAQESKWQLTWIDHHKSAIQDYEEFVGNGESFCSAILPKKTDGKLDLIGACELTWNHLFPDEDTPEIVELLGSYDSFRHKGSSDENYVFNFQYWARSAMENPRDCYEYMRMDKADTAARTIHGKSILDYLKVEAKSIYKNRLDYARDGVKFAAINRERFNPSSYDIPYHKDGYVFFMCYSRMRDGRWTVSLYNEDGAVDVSVIAKGFGGGGHARAAGFVSDNLEFLEQ